ncbi:uncharacterized protein LOC6554440 [Drosophila erecta]|uniref:GG11209 n=1 Tax=Drosophila erecta TaxID=7220 RepID=B3P7B9_DROER|nr:uncharacterized protein LOC6554440 [Drosophila erecta]EDV54008.1 uncharacterized protein Dere_GG11209 [Drosophila erecta]
MLSNISVTPAPELVDLYGLVLKFLLSSEATLFYFNPTGQKCSWETLLRTNLSSHPQIIWYREETYPGLYQRHSNNLFVMACLSSISYDGQLKLLAQSLTRYRLVRVLIEVEAKGGSFLASQILLLCQQYSMLNVALYFSRWKRTLSVFSYLAFPYFKVLKQRLLGSFRPNIFINQLADLQGYKIRIQPDLSPPNSFLYRDRHGEYRLGGYLWRIVENFSRSLRGDTQILYPTWKKGKVLAAEYMIQFTRNGSSDIGVTAAMITFKHEERYYDYSYPLFDLSWCTMLPVDKPLGVKVIFFRILSPGLALLLLLAFILCFLVVPQLMKLLGITFRGRLIRVASRIFALVMLCSSSAQLLSLLMSPPLQTRIKNFDDLLSSGLKIFGINREFYFLDGGFRAKYASVFHLTENPNELYDNRNYFNTSWAYTITSIKWLVIEAQQRHFAHPVFRYSQDMCFSSNQPWGLLIAPESLYREPLQHFTLNMNQAGLMTNWMTQSFYEMVRAGRMTIKDYSRARVRKRLRLKDLRMCWLILAVGLGTATGVFTIELLLFYTNVFLNSL